MEPASSEPSLAPPREALPPEAMKRLEAWLLLPPGDRAELLLGRIVYKAMTSIAQGDAMMDIGEQIGRLRGPPGDGGGGWWLSQDVVMVLAGQGLRPDMVGWRVARHPRPPERVNVGTRHLGVYVAPPDWVCEVLPGSTRTRDEADGVKWQAYYDAGVGHYWLVDLDREQLLVYRRGERSYEPIEVAGREAVKALPPFESVNFVARRVFLLSGLTTPGER